MKPPQDKGLGPPVKPFDETFSAETVIMDTFFPNSRRVIRTVDLIQLSEMDERHAHLDRLMDE